MYRLQFLFLIQLLSDMCCIACSVQCIPSRYRNMSVTIFPSIIHLQFASPCTILLAKYVLSHSDMDLQKLKGLGNAVLQV